MTRPKRYDLSEEQGERRVERTVARGRRIMMANRLAIGTLVWLAAGLGMWLPLLLADNVLRLWNQSGSS